MYNITARHFANHCCHGKAVLFIGLCVHACVYPGVCMCTSTRSLATPTGNAYAPYCDIICGFSFSIFFNIIS
jgi:hypothetical protein